MFGEKKFTIHKVIQRLLKEANSIEYKKDMVSTHIFFTKLSGIDPCEKGNNK